MFKDIIKALILHTETLPSYESWDGKTKTSLSVGSLKITCKANKAAIEKLIAKYEKGNVLPNFQNKLKWAHDNTRNFKQKPLKIDTLIESEL